jgi:hypothetical protein
MCSDGFAVLFIILDMVWESLLTLRPPHSQLGGEMREKLQEMGV